MSSDIDPELVKLGGRGLGRVEPDGAIFGFAKFLAGGFINNQWRGANMGFIAGFAADQVDAGDTIAPLVGTAYLQRHISFS